MLRHVHNLPQTIQKCLIGQTVLMLGIGIGKMKTYKNVNQLYLNKAFLYVWRVLNIEIGYMKPQIIEIGTPFVKVYNYTISLKDLPVYNI